MTLLKTKRMNLLGAGVAGPTTPTMCSTCTMSSLNSQSSMNSHRCSSEDSLVSAIAFIKSTMESTMLLSGRKDHTNTQLVPYVCQNIHRHYATLTSS